jgi:hypothetical protein
MDSGKGLMMHAFVIWAGALGFAFVFLAGPAGAVSLPTSIVLSEMSSEQEEGGTPPGPLDALVTVELSGTDLKITIDNDTSGGPGAGDYDISAVWLNLLGETIVSVSPAGAGSGATSTGFDLLAPPAVQVDGFGFFTTGFGVSGDVNQNPDLITAGEQDVMVLLSCADGDCSGASLEDNANGKAVAAKFVNGGSVFGDPNDSAFGASSVAVVPEPGTAGLVALGLLALASRRRGAAPR